MHAVGCSRPTWRWKEANRRRWRWRERQRRGRWMRFARSHNIPERLTASHAGRNHWACPPIRWSQSLARLRPRTSAHPLSRARRRFEYSRLSMLGFCFLNPDTHGGGEAGRPPDQPAKRNKMLEGIVGAVKEKLSSGRTFLEIPSKQR